MKHSHQVALWAATSAFFGSLLAIGVFDLLTPDKWLEYVSSLIVAFITAGGVYAKQRLDDAKADTQLSGSINMSETSNGLVYTLELNGAPEDLQHQDEVTFKVIRPK
jgi:hypothetical protein